MCSSSTPRRRKIKPSDKIKAFLTSSILLKSSSDCWASSYCTIQHVKVTNQWIQKKIKHMALLRGSPTLQYTINIGPEDADDVKEIIALVLNMLRTWADGQTLQYKSPLNRHQFPMIHLFQLVMLIIIVGLFRWSHRKETSTLVFWLK